MTFAPPHLDPAQQAITTKHGIFWIPGERADTPFGTVPRGPLFVEWQSPEVVTRPYPLVLVHGGGGQGTDWLGTPDGRPGWARRFVEAGFAVYIVDRPGHGRSPHHPEVLGQPSPPFSYELAGGLFAPQGEAETVHTEWIWERTVGGAELDQLVSSSGFMLNDVAAGQALDADRLARLLDLLGPSILVTHSASSAAGWLTAAARPELVKAIVAAEPMGPPFGMIPGPGELTWGLTHAPIAYQPAAASPGELHDGTARTIPGLVGHPVVVVTGGASIFATFAEPVVDFLNQVGARAEWMHLPTLGITGNGHGLMFERNSDEVIVPVIEWITGIR